MKVATVILAIAVASVSAKNPANEPLNFRDNEPAVRANAKEAGKLAVESAEYAAHSAADIAREAKLNVVDPSANVVAGTAKAGGHKTAGFFNGLVGDAFGAASAVQKGGARGLASAANWLGGSAQSNSRRFDKWHGAEENHDAAAADAAEQAKAPLRAGAQNVKNAAHDAKEKVVEVKDNASAKLHATKEEAKDAAQDAKDATVDGARAAPNKAKGVVHRVGELFGRGVEKTGAAVEEAGEKVKDSGANLRSREEQRKEANLQTAELKLEGHSGASTLAMSSAAIAVASAAAVYLI